VNSEIAALEREKVAAARSGNMAGARQCIAERRKKEGQRNKYAQLRDFCETTLARVTDVASINETMATVSAARRAFGDTKMDDLYDKMATSMQEISAASDNVADVHQLLTSRSAGDADEAELLAELEQLELEMQPAAPAKQPPAPLPGRPAAPAPEAVRAPTQQTLLRGAYEAMGVAAV
jgi:hypothetical protein